MSFDEIIDRRNTHSSKWDMMEPIYGVSPDDGLAMWVADMDFKPPQCVLDAIIGMTDHGVFGYYADEASYRAAICGWMERRHNWAVDPESIFTAHGLGNGTALCTAAFTDPGDAVVLFTPVYHAFAKYIKAAGRTITECEMVNTDGHYTMDFDAYDDVLTGKEKMLMFCSPHNPGGRVWTQEELQGVADFCVKHDLILVSDEIHHDLVFGENKHIPMPNAVPEISDRLVIMTAPSKTFNIAGNHTGNVIVHDKSLREKFATTMVAGGISANSFGLYMAEAAYTGGDAWVDELVAYLAENKRVFDEGVNAIPGLKSMNLEATYLAWVDFSGTGMATEEFINRVRKVAKIAPNDGTTFGLGGDSFLRFNLGAPRSVIEEAVSRLQKAFSDLQ
ncbi:pyridoxal phosphate-dependent aminotransferase [Amylibacter sp. SFDW26]|uniref:MalY/PatB family protein n=1 Tax=Amylibacter sp. SFDW26 TaxID=2652722 RepID=UPI001261D759|nr:MalY/PatB family protein [Amylibacter sp. SFDW26]KAB7614791.1 pyridoxal phosphate-dependent aminotransferase [Amylibacter sp. SFDW26]